MRPRRAPLWPALGLMVLIALAVHAASLWALPRLIMHKALQTVGGPQPPAPVRPPLATQTARAIVLPSPDLLYGVCVADLRRQDLAALGYHSPNMALTHQRRLERRATASDQEAVATLVLSGAFVGFLPDHYAEGFVRAGRMRAVAPEVLRYTCRFSAIVRQSPAPLRLTQAFLDALGAEHGGF